MSRLSLAIVALTITGLCSVARADLIYVDNHINITGYPTSNPASSSNLASNTGTVLSMAFTAADTNFPTQFILLTADDATILNGGGIYAYTIKGAQSVFASVANPLGLAIGPNGYVYVGANNGTTIQELTPTGAFYKQIATGVQDQSLAVDGYGDVLWRPTIVPGISSSIMPAAAPKHLVPRQWTGATGPTCTE